MSIKDKLASSLGSVLEWYDFALYAFFTPLIAQQYFPNNSNSVALLKALAVFAIGFIARPIGAYLFGTLSDIKGRIISLKATPILITIPTAMLGILPTYHTIGILAPILLVIFRIIQGICIGGEYANNIAYLCETSKKKRTYFMGSLGSCSASTGILLASIIATACHLIFTPSELNSIGWRLAFGLSLFIGFAVYYFRRTLNETQDYKRLLRENATLRMPFMTSISTHWRHYLIAFGLTYLPATSFYYTFTYLPNYLSTTLNIKPSIILGDSAVSLSIRLLIIPIVGLLADLIGGIKIARLSSILFIFLTVPLLYCIANKTIYTPAYFMILALMTTLNAGTTPGLLMTLLPLKTRCTMLALILNIAFGVFGGLTPVISLSLLNSTGTNLFSGVYLIFTAAITLLATYFFKEKIFHEQYIQTNK